MMPSFAAFFRVVHGYDPFPWQERLAEQVARDGWPPAIGVPTGLGKTACIDIAVWALACQAGRPAVERSAPTRTWYVVDRRLLIDAAFEHGEYLERILAQPDELRDIRTGVTEADVNVLATIRDALSAIAGFGTGRPLHIVRLRGGAELGQRSPDPSQPALIFATVAMYGSRLLFRGYGSSRLMRSVDAALAGTDSLVLLDEAHIARPLMRLVEAAVACDVGDPSAVLPTSRAHPRLVPLTATGDTTDDRFDLDARDREHKVIQRRLHARKPTRLVATTRKATAKTLAEEASGMAARSTTTVVFCNTARLARAVFNDLPKQDVDAELLTGRMRDREAARVRTSLFERIRAKRDRSHPLGKPIVVVATQTLEVGADLDFDALVTECAGARALIQRFGRLNRLGLVSAAPAVICAAEDEEKSPVYGDEPKRVWDALVGRAAAGELDMCPAQINDVVGPPHDAPRRTGELLPAHLWEYAKTTLTEPDEPGVDLFLSELDDDLRTVSVVWRAHRPMWRGDDDGENTRLEPGVRDDESVEVPIGEFRDFVAERGLGELFRLDRDGAVLERVAPSGIRPGDVMVLATSDGGYDEHGWDPGSRIGVLDVRALLWPVLWLDHGALESMADRPLTAEQAGALRVAQAVVRDENATREEWQTAVRALLTVLEDLGDANPARHPWVDDREWDDYCGGLHQAVDDMTSSRWVPTDGTFALRPLWRPDGKERVRLRSDAFDDLSFAVNVTSPELAHHLEAVGGTARTIARQLGLPPRLQSAVQEAGCFHDLGKADERFQRLLDPHGRHPGTQMAKSTEERGAISPRVDWPRGARHEAVSVQLLPEVFAAVAPSADVDVDLIVHLVASHHGYGRPLVPAVDEAAVLPVEVRVRDNVVRTTVDLRAFDWGQPRRFRTLCERYGYWGLSLLEAIVRQSDHAASAEISQPATGNRAPVDVA